MKYYRTETDLNFIFLRPPRKKKHTTSTAAATSDRVWKGDEEEEITNEQEIDEETGLRMGIKSCLGRC